MVKVRLVIIILLILLTSCTSYDLTVQTLDKAGYENVTTTGWSPVACDGYWYETGFIAQTQRGNLVGGVVCCGLMLKHCMVVS